MQSETSPVSVGEDTSPGEMVYELQDMCGLEGPGLTGALNPGVRRGAKED